jgi:hypothetical protein
MAAAGDKTYVRIGTGLDIDADIWHALASEVHTIKIYVSERERERERERE